MSRLKKFARSLVSGYLLLGANIFYTLASVPLALHYLGKEEFGLWALVSQLAGYILLVDFGMSGSVARILIDHKDDRRNGIYGSIIKTGALTGLVQGVLIVVAGTALSLLAGSLLNVPADLRHLFIWLMAGQSLITGVSFASRIFSNLLLAHQRVDVSNHASAAGFFLSLAVMWAGFAHGLGLFSFLLGQAVMTLGNVAVNIAGCVRLELFPRAGEWGRFSRERFRELFAFGGDIFIFTLGTQLINASQAVLLTRLFGLETAAVWNICTRTYTVLMQVLFRFFDYSAPALAEMMVRGETERLSRRFQQIVTFSASAAVAAGALFALGNGPFVTLWTHGRIGWPPVNDLLLAVWLALCTAMHAHTGLVGQSKRFHFMRYLFFLEGTAFVGLTLALNRWGGITAMLAVSILCTSSLSLPYGLYRTRKYFGLDGPTLAAWHRPAVVLAGWLVPAGLLIGWLTREYSAPVRLMVGGGTLGVWTTWAFVRHGLSAPLQSEIYRRAPDWTKPVFARLGFAKNPV